MVTQVDSAAEEHHTTQVLDDEPLIRGLSKELPGPLGNALATLVVLVGLALFVWSLIATWSFAAQNALPLFQVMVAVTVVSLTALYARKTFSYVIALIGAAAWLWVSILPIDGILQVLLQVVTVVIMAFGVNIALAAVTRNNNR